MPQRVPLPLRVVGLLGCPAKTTENSWTRCEKPLFEDVWELAEQKPREPGQLWAPLTVRVLSKAAATRPL